MQFADRYELGEKLGEGSMGIVYRARHRQLDLEFAIKVLHPQFASDPVSRARFLREARIVHAFIHKRSVTLREFGITDDGTPYLAMDLARGVKLSAILANSGPLPAKRAVGIALQVAEVLEEAHQHGIFHRDIKPDNIMIDPSTHEDQIIVMDFGIAKLAAAESKEASLTRGNAIGTPLYMSPEQAAGEALDGRSDLYSLGVVLWECLTGTPPFHGASVQAILMKHLTQEPPRPPDGLMDATLEALVRKTLAKEPSGRFPTAAAFRAAFLAWYSGPTQVLPLLSSAVAALPSPSPSLSSPPPSAPVPASVLPAPASPLRPPLAPPAPSPAPQLELSLRRERPDADISGEMPPSLRLPLSLDSVLGDASSSGPFPSSLSISPARETEEDERNTILVLPSPLAPRRTEEPVERSKEQPAPSPSPSARGVLTDAPKAGPEMPVRPEAISFELGSPPSLEQPSMSVGAPLVEPAPSAFPLAAPQKARRPLPPDEMESAATQPALELVRRAAQLRQAPGDTAIHLESLASPVAASASAALSSEASSATSLAANPPASETSPPRPPIKTSHDLRISLKEERDDVPTLDEPSSAPERHVSWPARVLVILTLLLVSLAVLARGGWLPEPLVQALLPNLPGAEQLLGRKTAPPIAPTPSVSANTEHLEAIGDVTPEVKASDNRSPSEKATGQASGKQGTGKNSASPCQVVELEKTSSTHYVRCLEVTLVGNAPPGVTVFSMGGKPVPVKQGRFSIPLRLVEGSNRLSLSGLEDGRTQTLTLVADLDKPKLSVLRPKDGQTFLRPRVPLEGEANDPNLESVSVNGKQAHLTAGSFRGDLTLRPGPNPVRITARDKSGNQTTLELTLHGPGRR